MGDGVVCCLGTNMAASLFSAPLFVVAVLLVDVVAATDDDVGVAVAVLSTAAVVDAKGLAAPNSLLGAGRFLVDAALSVVTAAALLSPEAIAYVAG